MDLATVQVDPLYLRHEKVTGQVTDCGDNCTEIQKALDPIVGTAIFIIFK